MANAASKVKALFIDMGQPLTLAKIKKNTDLKSSEISMALSHLTKYKWLSREFVKNEEPTNRFHVWEYTFHPERLK